MKKHTRLFLFLSAGLAALLIAGCAAQPQTSATSAPASPPAAAPAVETYADPFAYCTAVGAIDAPDARYTGEAAPDAVIKGYLKAAGIEENPEFSDVYKKMTIWRCMENKVYACNFGANLPCDSKANTDREPTQAMADFCKQNPGSDFIPMAVTGHETIYSWHCVKDAPELLEQISQVDAAGYIENIWYFIEAAP